MHIFGKEELEAVGRVFERKTFFRYQADEKSECDKFESELCEKFKTDNSLLVTSGTNALVAALAACGIGPEDEVIIPAYTFVATATAVINVGAVPVVVNINKTLSIDPDEIKANITNKTKAIIPVHMDGLCCDMEKICQIASEHGLYVIEDAAQSIGGYYQGKRLGTLGDVGCFSLNMNKNITCGEGGIIVTDNKKLFERIFCLHDASAQFNPAMKDFFSETTPFMGMSMRMSDISGAIIRVQLGRLDDILNKLKELKDIYIRELSTIQGLEIVRGNDSDGECSSSLHFTFPSVDIVRKSGNSLISNNIPIFPPASRPAHAVWKWSNLLNDKSCYHKQHNSYKWSEKKYNYHMFNFLPTAEILARTLMMNIDINQSVECASQTAGMIKNIIEKNLQK